MTKLIHNGGEKVLTGTNEKFIKTFCNKLVTRKMFLILNIDPAVQLLPIF